ncbi:uncharacterized protein VTP21DRAFT_1348 [Calcarisporiella thermophila]|uniref:uncharacterized protein n=1 Tax=Calcarisporiella thermophila TaxID=911321 RepID=UPI003742905A
MPHSQPSLSTSPLALKKPTHFESIPSFPATLGGDWHVLKRDPLHALMRFTSGRDLPPHHHPFNVEIHVLSGHVLLDTDSESWSLEPGHRVAVPAHCVHSIRVLIDACLEVTADATQFEVFWDFEER